MYCAGVLQILEAVYLFAPGGGGDADGAAEGGSEQTPRPQTTGCRGDQTGARKGGSRERQEVRVGPRRFFFLSAAPNFPQRRSKKIQFR